MTAWQAAKPIRSSALIVQTPPAILAPRLWKSAAQTYVLASRQVVDQLRVQRLADQPAARPVRECLVSRQLQRQHANNLQAAMWVAR